MAYIGSNLESRVCPRQFLYHFRRRLERTRSIRTQLDKYHALGSEVPLLGLFNGLAHESGCQANAWTKEFPVPMVTVKSSPVCPIRFGSKLLIVVPSDGFNLRRNDTRIERNHQNPLSRLDSLDIPVEPGWRDGSAMGEEHIVTT